MKTKKQGKVYLIGAGPGDPGLLTLRGLEIIRSADVILYDSLVNPSILEWAPQAEKIFAGKKVTRVHSTHYSIHDDSQITQNRINQTLVALARKGKTVARLKGGDPFVFGRGGEEGGHLKKAGISFEIIPGISAGHGVPAYAGIPVTDRRLASLAVFVTAHEDPSKKPTVDWETLAKVDGTLVLFMGVQTLPAIIKLLLRAGKPRATPISVIEHGTLPQQRVVEGTLKNIVEKIRKLGIDSPALAIIGEVNRLRKNLKWFDQKKLTGKTVMVTRDKSQNVALRHELEKEGAQVLEFPVIKIAPPESWAPLEEALSRMAHFDWVVFTSTNGVDFVFQRLEENGKDARIFSRAKVAAVGEATEARLKGRGIRPDFVPKIFTTAGLVAELQKKYQVRGLRFLLLRTDIAPPELKNGLERLGADVTEVCVYRTLPVKDAGKRKKLYDTLKKGGADFITFTSSSTVKCFFDSLPKKFRLKKSRLVSIGPVTSQTIREYGYVPYKEAARHTIPGLVEAMVHGQ